MLSDKLISIQTTEAPKATATVAMATFGFRLIVDLSKTRKNMADVEAGIPIPDPLFSAMRLEEIAVIF